MRKNKHFALGTAALLLSTAGFTACSSDDAFTGSSLSGEAVKTQFAINIPVAGKVSNRMGQDIVQADGQSFRGMSNIRLVPFKLTITPDQVKAPLTGGENLSYNAIVLGNIGNDELESTAKYKIYNNVELPLGVNAFLFYGEATAKSGDASDKTNGALVPSYSTQGLDAGATLANVHFDLKGILGSSDYGTPQDKLAGILTTLAKTDGWSSATGTLKPYYDSFISMKAGSASSILSAIQDLYNTVKGSTLQDDNGLKTKIANTFEQTLLSDIKVEGDAVPYTLAYTDEILAQYPTNLGLPDGAVQVKWNAGESQFKYVTDNINYGDDVTSLNVASLNKYVYPASLYYWDNTSLKTSTTQQSDNYGANDWSTILGNLYEEGWAVTASTQSVALAQPINYAVGRLDVNAAFDPGEIYDNEDKNPMDAQPVRIPADGFTLTGVLIGGQKNVGWDFTPIGSEEYTIYDAAVPANTGVTRTSGLKNSTLVLETAGNDEGTETVNFALEFTNNSDQAFYGKDGIVPVGGKFYLVGQLQANSDHKKVFEKDHFTTAKVTIKSLANAYNCIPDLRSPKLELGLSVDLEWHEGLVDDVTIL